MTFRLKSPDPMESELQSAIIHYLRNEQLRGRVVWFARNNGGGTFDRTGRWLCGTADQEEPIGPNRNDSRAIRRGALPVSKLGRRASIARRRHKGIPAPEGVGSAGRMNPLHATVAKTIMTDPIDAFACHRCQTRLVPPCVGHQPCAIELTLKCGDCGHEHRGWVEYGQRTRIHETPVVLKK